MDTMMPKFADSIVTSRFDATVEAGSRLGKRVGKTDTVDQKDKSRNAAVYWTECHDMNTLRLGSQVRHAFTSKTGTIGIFAEAGGAQFLLSCDHVLRARFQAEEPGWDLVHEPGGKAVGVWARRTLASPDHALADLAAGTLTPELPASPGRLPQSFDGVDRLLGMTDPVAGMSVTVYGAASGFHRAVVTQAPSDEELPHPIFGPRVYPLQFEIKIVAGELNPARGDSGGPVFTRDGHLVGFLSSEVRTCLDEPEGLACLAYCVPARQALEELALNPILEDQ